MFVGLFLVVPNVNTFSIAVRFLCFVFKFGGEHLFQSECKRIYSNTAKNRPSNVFIFPPSNNSGQRSRCLFQSFFAHLDTVNRSLSNKPFQSSGSSISDDFNLCLKHSLFKSSFQLGGAEESELVRAKRLRLISFDKFEFVEKR